jgi:hypothetical protein
VLRLVRRCIDASPGGGGKVAFVSMPFKPPFAARYAAFYAPLLKELGYAAFRAWGGLALENYWDLLNALIRRSDLVFAELTGHNPNVMHEVGLAEGMDKTVLMVAEKGFESPSNLNYHGIVTYDPEDRAWPGSSIEVTATLLRGGLAGHNRRLARERSPLHEAGTLHSPSN